MDVSKRSDKKTALITGASGGIGFELTKLFARDGHDLVLVARSGNKLDHVRTQLERRHGISVRTITKDLADPSAPEEIFKALEQAGVQIDVLVNNAGYAMFDPFVDMDIKRVMDMLQVNIMALTHLSWLFVPGMVQRGQGRVLNLGSTASFLPGPLMACYYASKAYVLSFSEAIANELHGTGVTVTALCPGPTETGFQKRANVEESKLIKGKRIMEAGAVARAGYKALMAGKPLVVPGLSNNLIPLLARLSPRGIVTEVVKRSQERVDH
jgi:uncharacterized protein